MEGYVTRTLSGLVAADDDTRKVIERHKIGSTFPVDIPSRLMRSGKWNSRYWVLCSMLANNLERVEVEPGVVLPIRNKEDVHVAMKYATGLFDQFVTEAGVIRIVKSTAFDRMTPDEWGIYWAKVLDAVHRIFLPGIDGTHIENEIAMLAS